jgi:hypothetical protein
MASKLSDLLDIVASLEDSARRGDWPGAGRLASLLPRQSLPANGEALGEYLRCLKQALIAARVSRAWSAASLVRLNAAARFNKIRLDTSPARQEFGEAPDF